MSICEESNINVKYFRARVLSCNIRSMRCVIDTREYDGEEVNDIEWIRSNAKVTFQIAADMKQKILPFIRKPIKSSTCMLLVIVNCKNGILMLM
jgi:hypothetical protein